jgi:hypothetical protein
VLIETAGYRYRYVIVEVAEPAAVVQAVAEATHLAPPVSRPPEGDTDGATTT